MGYTHYWDIKKAKPADLKLAIADMGKIAKHFAPILAGRDGEGRPVITPNEITFNGKGDDSHETFSITNSPHEEFGFCKTAEKPYDVAVVACLAALKDRCKDSVSVRSDGGPSAIQHGASKASSILGRKIKIESVKGEDMEPLDIKRLNEHLENLKNVLNEHKLREALTPVQARTAQKKFEDNIKQSKKLLTEAIQVWDHVMGDASDEGPLKSEIQSALKIISEITYSLGAADWGEGFE